MVVPENKNKAPAPKAATGPAKVAPPPVKEEVKDGRVPAPPAAEESSTKSGMIIPAKKEAGHP